MSELPTVEIANADAPSGFTRINASDYDPSKHTLYGEEAKPDTDAMRAEIEARMAAVGPRLQPPGPPVQGDPRRQ